MSLPNEVIVSTSKLTAIGDAIRSKTGGQAELTLDEMATAVSGIGGLPSEYEQVDYIESTGTQYIDTGFTANQFSAFFCDFEFTSTTGTQTMGFNGYPNNLSFGIADNKMSIIWGSNGNWTRVQSSPDTQKHFWGASPYGQFAYFDNTSTFTNRGNSFTTGSIYLFATKNSTGVFNFCNCKVYSAQLYDGYTKTRDFVPCYRKSDKVIGLYDIINGQFYTNQGSGSFTCYPAPPSN